MRNRSIVLALSLLALAPLSGITGSPARAADKPELPAVRMRALMPGAEAVRFDADGQPSFVRGRLGHVDTANVGGSVEEFLAGEVASVMRMQGRERFQARGISRDEPGPTHVRVQQYIGKLPVVGRDLVVHVDDASGDVVGFNGRMSVDSGVSEAPSLGARAALFNGIRTLGIRGSHMDGRPELTFIATDNGDVRLAWVAKVEFQGAKGTELERIFVDANNGQVVARHALIHSAKSWKTYTASNGTSLPGTLKITDSGTSTDSVLQTIHNNTSTVYDYYYTTESRDSYTGTGATITSTGHYSSNYVNAYWNGTQMVYGDGNGTDSNPLGGALDVVGHELTHAVTENTADLVYQKEPGALNEAWSDIMAAGIEAWKDGSASADTWKVGEDVWTPATSGDALRYMNNPTADGYSTDYYPERMYAGTCNPTQSNDYCGVHGNSGIANLAFYLASQGGTHPRGKTTTSVTGVGITKAAHIFYRALATYLTSSSDFAAARTATIQAATDLYGQTEADAIGNAWAAVGVGSSGGGGGSGTATQLANGTAVSNLSGSTGAEANYYLDVTSGASNLVFQISGGSGDADLYVKFGSQPTTSSYDCRPYKSGNAESCTFASPTAGRYYVMLRAYSSYSGVSLLGSFTSGSTNSAPTAGFTYSVSGLTATFTDTSTDSDGSIASRSWSFGDGSTSTSTNPSKTYSASGTYTVSLTVTDNAGATGTTSKSVTVTSSGGGSCPSGYTAYTGTLSGTGDSDVQPNGTYYTTSVSGYQKAQLSGPSGTDFDLYLYKYYSGSWKKVKSSLGSTSTESISYNGSAASYYWLVSSYSGSGSYTLCTQRP
ncbi:MAG: M4 family metallopeptidase [Candidatus Schekmanbacteria bacterium]|nr:M4 family metallopeptidase [Candidatus Schekmanbacteria bacterium]